MPILDTLFPTPFKLPEQQNIEYKSAWRDEYLKWICGFANAQGGKIYIGIDDNGKVVGLANYRKLMDELPNKIVNFLGLVVDVNLHEEEGKYFIVIDVPISSVPISYHGVYQYRSGSTKQELKGTALQEFLLRKMGKTWDDLPVNAVSAEELNRESLSRFVDFALGSGRVPGDAEKYHLVELLNNLRLVSANGLLKNAAVLLFGNDPQKLFLSSYFKIGRFGVSDSDLKFQDTIEGNIFDMADKVISRLKEKYLISPISYEGTRRIETLEYPEAALREAVLNAIVHRDYADNGTIQLSVYNDRMILWNPGTLPYDLTIDQLKSKHPSRPRNKNIAEIFFRAGYIESWGRGIDRILQAFDDAGLPEPIFEEIAGGVQVTFFKDSYTEERLRSLGINKRQIIAILYVKKHGSITNKEYQAINDLGKSVSATELAELVEKQLLERIGTTGRATKYVLKS